MKTSFTSRQFEVLLAVTECGGFAAAGRALGISQPAVTKQIRALEAKVGYRLFEVSAGSTPGLTARGKKFIQGLPDLVAQLQFVSGSGADAAGDLPVIRVACGDAIAEQIGSHLPEIYRAVPGVVLEVRLADPSVTSAFRMQDGEIDLAYFSLREPPSARLGAVIGKVEGSLFAPAHFDPRLGHPGYDPLPFISVPANSVLSREMEFGLRAVGIVQHRVVARLPTITARRALAVAGLGAVLGMEKRMWELVDQGVLRPAGHGSTTLCRCRFVNPRRASDRSVSRIEQALTSLLREA